MRAPFTEVEVEYYNESDRYEAPASPFITQVIKTDKNGVFPYAMPKAGWWGFAALSEDSRKIRRMVWSLRRWCNCCGRWEPRRSV